MRKRGAKRAEIAAAQCIDQHESGSRGYVIFDTDASRHRRPSQVHRKKQDEQKRPPKDGHRITGERYAHDRIVRDGVALDRRHNTCRQTHDDRKQQREERELDRRGEQRQEFGGYVFMRRQRRAEIAAQDLPDVFDVLNGERFVQSEFMQQPLAASRVHAALARNVLDRIARNQMDQREREQRHADERRND